MGSKAFRSRGGFIFACVGAAVGLGDALRFPGLCAKYGASFIFAYFFAMLILGIPLLNAEIALGRKFRAGAPACMAKLNSRSEWVGWAACFNSLFVAVLYAGILGWVIAMVVKIAPVCVASTSSTRAQTSAYFFEKALGNFSPLVLACIVIGWALIYLSLKNGMVSLSKTAKITVTAPILLLTVMAVRGLIYSNSATALRALFVPDFSAFANAELWLSAVGQVFFSISVLCGIMPVFGAYLSEKESIFKYSIIIALSDFCVSVLSAAVLFTTLYGCGLENRISISPMATAFMVYPVAISQLFGIGNTVINSIAGILFYCSLGLMALQSCASMIEGAIKPLSDKFSIKKSKLLQVILLLSCAVSLVFATGFGQVVLDIVDHFLNYFDILILGIVECICIGKSAKGIGLAQEINKLSRRLRIPQAAFIISLKYVSPTALATLLGLGLYKLFAIERGIYGGYPVWAQVLGWTISASVFVCGAIAGRVKRR